MSPPLSWARSQRSQRRAALLFLCLATVEWGACSPKKTEEPNEPPEEPPPEEPEEPTAPEIKLPPPSKLSRAGIYADLERLEFSESVVPYEPRYPLWTNGSSKQRGIALPQGETVEWEGDIPEFPDGTVFVKTFSYESSQNARQVIETRLLYKLDGRWDYAAYQWNADGSEATKLDGAAATPVAVEFEGDQFNHTIPARLDCRSCHESQRTTVLGFSALQIGGEEQLERLTEKGVFAEPPSLVPAVTAERELDEQVLGYFVGNCIHCHNGGNGPSSAFSLEPEQAFHEIIDRPTTGELVSGYRVVSGSPRDSGLYLALSRENHMGQAQAMPPLGVDRRDDAGLDLIGRWIESLPVTSETPDLGAGGAAGD